MRMSITIETDISLTCYEVKFLLEDFDIEFTPSLSSSLCFDDYSEKLSQNAHFVIAYNEGKQIGFIAYYLNEVGRFIYIPLIAVKREGYQHQGIGRKMLRNLEEKSNNTFDSIRLEVLKSNLQAMNFYQKQGFVVIEDRVEKLLLSLCL